MNLAVLFFLLLLDVVNRATFSNLNSWRQELELEQVCGVTNDNWLRRSRSLPVWESFHQELPWTA
jgi:hypothetical protein